MKRNNFEFKVFGQGVKLKVMAHFEASFSESSTTTVSVTEGRQFATPNDEDMVLYYGYDLARYYYVIETHPDSSQIGDIMEVRLPTNVIAHFEELDEYNTDPGDGPI